jgi:hypothetical protein
MPVAAAAGAVEGGGGDDALVAILSAQGVVQVWHFSSASPSLASSSSAAAETVSLAMPPPKHHALPHRRGSIASLDDASAASSDAPLRPLLCGLHSIGACGARDELPLAFGRAAGCGGGGVRVCCCGRFERDAEGV